MIRLCWKTKSVVSLAIAAAIGSGVSSGAFFSTTTQATTGSNAGNLEVTASGNGDSLFNGSNLQVNDQVARCLNVQSTGDLSSQVRIFSNLSFTPSLAASAYSFKIVRGTGTTAFGDCTGFVADATNYIGAGAGVIWNGTADTFASTYPSGLLEPTPGSPRMWTPGESHDYQFVVTIGSNILGAGSQMSGDWQWTMQS
jgi:hypothetical protein